MYFSFFHVDFLIDYFYLIAIDALFRTFFQFIKNVNFPLEGFTLQYPTKRFNGYVIFLYCFHPGTWCIIFHTSIVKLTSRSLNKYSR